MTVEFQSSVRPWQRLANGIVEQAAHDYRMALRGLNVDPCSHSALAKSVDLERFFRSDYIMILTRLDGEFLIEELRKEANQSKSKSNQGKKNTTGGGR